MLQRRSKKGRSHGLACWRTQTASAPPRDEGDRGALNPAQPVDNSEKLLRLRTGRSPHQAARRVATTAKPEITGAGAIVGR